MERRTYLSAVCATVGAVAGCTNRGASTDTSAATGTPTRTATPAPPKVIDSSLEPRENCRARGAATIAVDGMSVVVEGCIVGKDGCQHPVLDSVTYDEDADELLVRVTTEKRSDADACTQQLVDLPYRVTVTFENGLPGTTRVIHDGVDGERQAGEAETN
jgi:hypothetical protein